MAILTSIAGPSGSGKTRSLKDLDWDKVFVVRPNKKPFSFPRSHLVAKEWDSKTKTGNFAYIGSYEMMSAVLQKLPEYGKTIIIIDDSTHFMTDEFMSKIDQKGYDKFAEMAGHYYGMIKVAESLPSNIRVYIMNHTESDANGDIKIKTIGKMLDEKVDIPSFLTICLGASKTKDGWKFRTQSTGRDFFKSPEELFSEDLIDNNLKMVDDSIKEYYGIED